VSSIVGENLPRRVIGTEAYAAHLLTCYRWCRVGLASGDARRTRYGVGIGRYSSIDVPIPSAATSKYVTDGHTAEEFQLSDKHSRSQAGER
jgi:hypothetical protein